MGASPTVNAVSLALLPDGLRYPTSQKGCWAASKATMVKRSTSHENRMQPRGLLALQTLLSLNSFAASLIVHLALVVGLALMAVPSLRSDGERGASLVSDPGVESELELPT